MFDSWHLQLKDASGHSHLQVIATSHQFKSCHSDIQSADSHADQHQYRWTLGSVPDLARLPCCQNRLWELWIAAIGNTPKRDFLLCFFTVVKLLLGVKTGRIYEVGEYFEMHLINRNRGNKVYIDFLPWYSKMGVWSASAYKKKSYWVKWYIS